jgi:hypothetical protein
MRHIALSNRLWRATTTHTEVVVGAVMGRADVRR